MAQVNPEIEKIIDMAYKEWLDSAGRADRRRKHPSREEYGTLFRQIFPYAGTILLLTKYKSGGEDGGN